MASVPSSLMVGSCCGNRFVVLDDRSRSRLRGEYVTLAWSNLQKYGADSFLVVTKSSKASIRMRIFERDGSESDSCGNGALLIARMLNLRTGSIETRGGLLKLKTEKESHSVTINTPPIAPKLVPGRTDEVRVRIGEPHLVRVVDHVKGAILKRLGELTQKHYRKGMNVNLIQKVTKSKYFIRTYERGVLSETKSCGTGALAAWMAISALNPAPVTSSICFVSSGGRHLVSKSKEGLVLTVQRKYIQIGSV
jgi:diaminopimelate epimerase